MERICSLCHAVVSADLQGQRCPACGADLIERPAIPEADAGGPPREIDRRGIVLPRGHALGGIITPQ